MSAGLFQTVPGAHEMSGANALANEPWLLPISDRTAPAAETPDMIAQAVRKASRRLFLAANTLGAALVLLLTAQIATDWRGGASNPGTGQIADATPPTIAVEKANLSGR